MRTTPQLLIISSPSGAGKTTLCRRLTAEHPRFQLSVSHTTRRPRTGEEDGREYYFIGDRTFDSMLDTHQFAEWAQVHQHRYGTARNEIVRIFAADRSVLFDIDWQGTKQVQQRYPKAISVFILPPSMEELSRRLRSRATDSEDSIAVRLKNAAMELEHYHLYDHLIINDDVEAAYADLVAVANGQAPLRPAPGLADVDALLEEVGR